MRGVAGRDDALVLSHHTHVLIKATSSWWLGIVVIVLNSFSSVMFEEGGVDTQSENM